MFNNNNNNNNNNEEREIRKSEIGNGNAEMGNGNGNNTEKSAKLIPKEREMDQESSDVEGESERSMDSQATTKGVETDVINLISPNK